MSNSHISVDADGMGLPAPLLAHSAVNSFPASPLASTGAAGAGRLEEFAAELAALPPPVRDKVTRMLDRVSRPMTVREIERALRPGTTRSQRISLAKALKAFSILAIVDDGGAGLHSTEGN